MSVLGDDVRTLVAGVGNIFLRDDGFGSEVARHMLADASLREALPEGVRVVDYGIGGVHLAYDLLDGVDLLILVDAVPLDAEPGTLAVLEIDERALPPAAVDSHAMDPAAVLANVRGLGGTPPRTLLVGCRPADVTDGMGLTAEVAAAVEPAVALVHQVVAEHHRPATADGTAPSTAAPSTAAPTTASGGPAWTPSPC